MKPHRTYMGDICIATWLKARSGRASGQPEVAGKLERTPAFWGGSRVPTEDEFRAMSVGTPAEGGYLAPSPLSNSLGILRDKHERISPRAFQVMSPAQTLSLPAELAVGAVDEVDENENFNTAGAQTDSTFAELALTKGKIGRYVLLPWELVNYASSAFAVVNIIVNQGGRKLAAAWDSEFATRTYTVIASGDDLEGNSSIGEVTTAAAALTRDKVTDLILGLGSEFRVGGGVYLMGSPTVTGYLTALEDTNGRPLYSNANEPTQVLSDVGTSLMNVEGIPYLEVPFATQIPIVGNLGAAFAVMSDGGLRVDTSEHVKFAEDQIAVRIVDSRSGGVWMPDYFKKPDNAWQAPA